MAQTTRVSPERDPAFLIPAALIMVLAAVPRFWAAWVDQGLFWPDEIFQSLEQAHRLAFGYGVVPWEFRMGARSWVFPGLIAGLLKLGAWLGLDSGEGLVLLAKSSMALLSLLGVYFSLRFSYQLAGRVALILTGAFAGFFSVSLLLASRCSSETASGPLLMAAVLLSARSGRARQFAAGALSGLAIFLRYQNGLVALGLLAIMLSERRVRDVLEFAAAAAVVGLLGGALDWVTWGSPFHAFRKYLFFNLYKSAAKFGAYPFTYYATVSWSAVGAPILAVVLGLGLSYRRAPKLLALVVLYVLVHCVVPHKEYRFLMPIAPLALALAGVGLADAFAKLRHDVLASAVLAVTCAVWMSFSTSRLTWGRLGFPSDRENRSPWHSGEGINRLLWSVGRKDDACGVIVTGESFGWIGGYSYLHRDVNMFSQAGEGERAAANYLIAPQVSVPPSGYRELSSAREFGLYRRAGGCAAAPADYRRELP